MGLGSTDLILPLSQVKKIVSEILDVAMLL